MSSPAQTRKFGTGQQTLHDAINSQRIYKPVQGVKARVELPEDEEWLRNNHDITSPVINFSEAFEVEERDGDLSQVLEPWHTPIILGTEEDEVVDQRGFQQILDLLEAAQPLIYVPDVAYNYQDMDEDKQENAVDAYIHHVRTLQQEVFARDLDARLIPTNKGWKIDHFEKYLELFDEFNYDEFAFYAVQYTGGDAGNAIRKLRRHITHMIATLDPENVFVIGRSSRYDLLRFDPRVQGAAGLRQWKNSQDPFPEWQTKHEAALEANNDQQQSYLSKFNSAEIKVQ